MCSPDMYCYHEFAVSDRPAFDIHIISKPYEAIMYGACLPFSFQYCVQFCFKSVNIHEHVYLKLMKISPYNLLLY